MDIPEDQSHFSPKSQDSRTRPSSPSSIDEAPAIEATFSPFPKLPIEIRTQIWKLQIPPPRIIKLTYYLDTNNEIIQAPVLATPLLHTCHESRKVAKKFYEIGFEGCKWPAHPIYIDWNRDTIWLERGVGRVDYDVCRMNVPRSAFDVAWQSSVQHLAISSPRNYTAAFTKPWRLDYFGGLETLTLEVLFDNGGPDAGWNFEGQVSNLKRGWAENASFGPGGRWPKIQFVRQGAVRWQAANNRVRIHLRSCIVLKG